MRYWRRRPFAEWCRRDVRGGARQVIQHPVEIRPALEIVIARALNSREQRRITMHPLLLIAFAHPHVEHVDGAAVRVRA